MQRWKFASEKVVSGGQFVFSAIRLSARPLPICPMKTDWTCREDRNQGVEFGSKMRFFSFLYFIYHRESHPLDIRDFPKNIRNINVPYALMKPLLWFPPVLYIP